MSVNLGVLQFRKVAVWHSGRVMVTRRSWSVCLL